MVKSIYYLEPGGRRIPFSSELGLQHSETPHTGLGSFSSNWTTADPVRLLGRPLGPAALLLCDICKKKLILFLSLPVQRNIYEPSELEAEIGHLRKDLPCSGFKIETLVVTMCFVKSGHHKQDQYGPKLV